MDCNNNNHDIINNTNNHSLVNLLKVLSIGMCKDVYQKFLKDLLKLYLKIEDNKEDKKKQNKKGNYPIIEWKIKNKIMNIDVNEMIFTWGYIFSGNIIDRNGSITPIQFMASNIKQHEDPRFLVFDVNVIKLESDLFEYKENNLPIGNALYDTKNNNINIVFEFDKQSKFNYNYFKNLDITLKDDGFEGWVNIDVNYKKNDAAILDSEVDKLNKEVEFILLTSRNKSDSHFKYKGNDFIIINNIVPLSNGNDLNKMQKFLNSNKKLYSYWSQRFLDETYFKSKK